MDEVLALVGWAELDELLAGISSSSKGESGWPPLALLRALLAAVMRQRDARGVVVRTGTLVDAALIPSVSTKDEQARWAGIGAASLCMATRRMSRRTRTPA